MSIPPNQHLEALLTRLESLVKRHNDFGQEITDLREEIKRLKQSEYSADIPLESAAPEVARTEAQTFNPPVAPAATAVSKPPAVPKPKSDLEKFIGENLINKIGIIITVLGVGIGAKYAIDHDMISPAMRIILGYLVGVGLLVFAIRLKKNYHNFSAVLLSGSMAILYFITYAAYNFYDLMPQGVAFGLMVVITIITVISALQYDRQVIAHIGLVGAYAVPFLLSPESGDAIILFSYVAIINIGILVIAVKRYWKSLYYVAFGFTSLIYLIWYEDVYEDTAQFVLAAAFAVIYFATFYVIFLAYKLLHKETFRFGDILMLLANSFIFYAVGYGLLDSNERDGWLGLFTIGNAIIHGVVSLIIYRQQLATKSLFYFVSGLVLVFLTLAIPVELDGGWVTFLWAGEAAALFWVARTQGTATYERLGYALMFLAFFSLAHDWQSVYDTFAGSTHIPLVFNVNFLISILCVAAFGLIAYLNYSGRYPSPFGERKGLFWVFSFLIPVVLLMTLYWAIRMEIATYWDQQFQDAEGSDYLNRDLWHFKSIWVINYSLLFLAILSLVNLKRLQSRTLGITNLIVNLIAALVFLGQGLYVISELRESYLEAEPGNRDVFFIGIRYVSYLFIALILVVNHSYIRQAFMRVKLRIVFDILLHIAIVWLASSEILNLMDLGGSTQSNKLGLSILWGVYALALIVLGIWRHQKHLRICAIVLFGITLIKLFFYDITDLNTIAKTIVFVSLGVLLLIISFLYQKYRKEIG
jgi:uncharacterized membrane protein